MDTDKVDLLPPSAFETHCADDAWKELARATNQIMQLKLENQKLREKDSMPKYVHHLENRMREDVKEEDRKYIDEIIKQSSDITDLKKEIQSLKCQHKQELLELEKQHTYKERQHIQRTAELEAELKSKEECYDSQVNKLSYAHQKQTEELEVMVQDLRDELSLTLSRSRDRVEELETKLRDVQEKSSQCIGELEAELKSKNMTIENQSKQISQLKNYIGEAETVPRPMEIWRKEKETLENRLKICEIDRENSQSNLQLLNIRLNSMKEILNIQENELSKANKEKLDKSKQENVLLTRWREKVYQLLVQQKSSYIVSKKDEQNWLEKMSDLNNKMSALSNQIEVLTHSLSDKQAQLDMESNTNKQLQQELYQAQQMALSLDDRLQENVSMMEILQQFSQSIGSKFDRSLEVLNKTLGTLKAYGQRISFASSRIEVLQGVVARNEAMNKLNLKAPEALVTESASTESVSHISSELERVTKERDKLAVQLREDSQTWNERFEMENIKQREENCRLRKTVEDLEQVLQEKSQKCTDFEELAEKLQTELEEAYDTIDQLKIEIGKRESGLQQVISEQKGEIEEEFREQLAEYDRKLSDAKREHTKAVVSLRQLERQSARDKERSCEHLQTVEEHYTCHIAGLQEQLKSLEKERNLMMATLRQEGLLGRVKAERLEPAKLEDISPQYMDNSQLNVSSPVPNILLDREKEEDAEPISAVLEDLKALTTAVLEDNLSSSDSES